MTAGMYDLAAQAPIMNTYVPINFNELYRIGSALKASIDEASQRFGALLQKFGEFRSPSAVDTENYYKNTIGRLDVQDAITQMVSNPDAMKDAGFRANLLSIINSTDYGTLSQLKESADNLRAGMEMRAKMEAEGRYKKDWDTANITGYDTLGNKKVFEDITPTRFMTADELSNPYFSNLKPSSLGPVVKDGVKYQRQGITMDTLTEIASARFNDLVNTPQGQQYYREALQATGGDPEAAKEAFVGMIADSLRDRLINQDEIDPAWLMQAKAQMSGQTQTQTPLPTRQEKITYDLAIKASLAYGNLATGKVGSQVNRLTETASSLADSAKKFADRYKRTGNEEDLIRSILDENKALEVSKFAYDLNRKQILKDEFKRIAQFEIKKDPTESKEYSRSGYIRGVSGALNKVSTTIGLAKQGDPVLTVIGGTPQEYTTEQGLKTNVYLFNNSQGFFLPESVFQLGTETNPDNIKRTGVAFWDEFPIREAIETGQIKNVQFIPNSSNNIVLIGNNKMLSGSMRISADEAERVLGTNLFGASTRNNLKNQFGMTEEKYGKDGEKYYDIPIYKALPADSNLEYWDQVNQLQENSPSQGGIGGATLAQGMHAASIESILRNR